MDSAVEQFGYVVTLNVGGCYFTASLEVLRRYEGSRLAAIFNGLHVPLKDGEGRHFIDRDGTNFGHILNFLRDSQLPPADKVKEVYKEARYYKIEPLVEALRKHRSVFEEEDVSFAKECPEALEKVTEVASILRQRFANTLSRSCTCGVTLQFSQEQAWKSVRKSDRGRDVSIYIPPQELEEATARQDHRCSSLDVLLGEMSESDRVKHLSFFTRYLHRLGYNVTVSERDCGAAVWSQPVRWSDGTVDTTIHCAKKLHILTCI